MAMRRTLSLPVIVALIAALGAIAIAAIIAYYQIGRTQVSGDGRTITAFSPSVELGGAFELVDHEGRTVTEADFQGQFMLIYFGYTYCPDFCPSELQNMAVALTKLDRAADRVTPIFISIDPERDTVDAIREYVPHFHDRMVGLTGSARRTVTVAVLSPLSVRERISVRAGSEDQLMRSVESSTVRDPMASRFSWRTALGSTRRAR